MRQCGIPLETVLSRLTISSIRGIIVHTEPDEPARLRGIFREVVMARSLIHLLAVLLAAGTGVLRAGIIHVPADSSTIQAGILGASDGDTVLVADGVYTGPGNRDISFFGRAIVVMSENGLEATVVDCEAEESDPHRGFTFTHGEDSSSVLQGFTVRNGHMHYGGGISCAASSPLITGNILLLNNAHAGGGVSLIGSSAIVRDNLLTHNHAVRLGGGVMCAYGSPVIELNELEENSAFGGTPAGGGIGSYESSPTIRDNVLAGNRASGIYSTAGGGGIVFLSSTPSVTGNLIVDNEASADHGGRGGGIFGESSEVLIDGNTLIDNYCYPNIGNGIDLYDCISTVTNTIVGYQPWYQGTATFHAILGETSVSYCNFAEDRDGEGMLSVDPVFLDPEAGDYRLSPDSPCLDAGDPAAPPPPRGGDRRDIGALEYPYPETPPLRLAFTGTPESGMPGETVGWEFTIENLAGDDIVFDGWITVSGPASSDRDSILSASLAAGESLSGRVRLVIPLRAPPGVYAVKGYVGVMHEEIWDGEVFDGEVVGALSGTPWRPSPNARPDIRLLLSETR